MDDPDFREIPWREPWHAFRSSEFASQAESELLRELCATHSLFGRTAKAIGHRQDCDDVLFYLGAAQPGFAVVHLTYQREPNPRWPDTKFFNTLDDWLRQGLTPDAEKWGT